MLVGIIWSVKALPFLDSMISVCFPGESLRKHACGDFKKLHGKLNLKANWFGAIYMGSAESLITKVYIMERFVKKFQAPKEV